MGLKNLIPSFGRKNAPVMLEEEHPFTALQRDMNRLFEGFLRNWEFDPFEERFGAFNPRIDMAEDDKTVTISAELPGMNDKDVEVSLDSDSLTIRGEKKNEKEERRDNYFYSERSFGSFSRTIPLPRSIEADKVQAKFKKGILTITLPKTANAVKDARKISVKAE